MKGVDHRGKRCHFSSLLTLDTSRKTYLKSGGWGIGLGGRRVEGGFRVNFRGIFENFPGNIREISRIFRRGPYVKTDIVTRELKIF